MNYLEAARTRLDQSMGDVRDTDYRDRLTALATAYTGIAQAEALVKIAGQLERIGNLLADLTGDSALNVRVDDGRP